MQLLSVVTAEERRGTDKVLEEKLELGKEGEREYGGRDTVLIVDDIEVNRIILRGDFREGLQSVGG